MRALIHDPAAPQGLTLGEVPDPVPAPGQAPGVLENVGGPLLAQAFSQVAEGGRVVSIGQASQLPTTIDFEEQRHRGGNRSIEPFTVGDGFGPDLGYLAGLLASGGLDPQIGWRSSWGQASDAAAALLGRQILGKAVLTVD